MKNGLFVTVLGLIIVLVAFGYILYLGLTIEAFNPVMLVAVLSCLAFDLTRGFRKLAKALRN